MVMIMKILLNKFLFACVLIVKVLLLHQIAAISETDKPDGRSSLAGGGRAINMHAVVAATEDLFKFILSDKGYRVRVFLIKDIIIAGNIFLRDEILFHDKWSAVEKQLNLEVCLVSFFVALFISIFWKQLFKEGIWS